MEHLRAVMNREAAKIGASEIALVATLALLAAQLCDKHVGDNVAGQDQWLDEFFGAIKTSLSVHTSREPEDERQRVVVDRYRGRS